MTLSDSELRASEATLSCPGLPEAVTAKGSVHSESAALLTRMASLTRVVTALRFSAACRDEVADSGTQRLSPSGQQLGVTVTVHSRARIPLRPMRFDPQPSELRRRLDLQRRDGRLPAQHLDYHGYAQSIPFCWANPQGSPKGAAVPEPLSRILRHFAWALM